METLCYAAVCGGAGPDRCSHLRAVWFCRGVCRRSTRQNLRRRIRSAAIWAALMNYGREEDNDEI